MLKESAILIAIAEVFPNETFSVYLDLETFFIIKLSKSGTRVINLDDYKLEDNTLTWTGHERERKEN